MLKPHSKRSRTEKEVHMNIVHIVTVHGRSALLKLYQVLLSFNFHIFQQWQRNWLAFCNNTPIHLIKKNHFFHDLVCRIITRTKWYFSIGTSNWMCIICFEHLKSIRSRVTWINIENQRSILFCYYSNCECLTNLRWLLLHDSFLLLLHSTRAVATCALHIECWIKFAECRWHFTGNLMEEEKTRVEIFMIFFLFNLKRRCEFLYAFL